MPNYAEASDLEKIYTVKDGTIVGVSPGRKSQHDFRVRYQQKGKKVRTPRHMHIIIDLYMKLVGEKTLTMEFIDHIINNVISKIQPSTGYPPNLQVFNPSVIKQFEKLNKYGEYSVEFLLVVVELIQIQEKTNYPKGILNKNLFTLFRKGADIFSIVSAATFRGGK